MRAQNLDELAAKLRRPPTGLSAFKQLTPDQIGLLSDLVDETVARRRREVEAAGERAIPPRPIRAVVLRVMRRHRG